ncbi:MAG: CpaD family pilus assembly protein [Fimbriimonadaceae bacterium]|nr:CpaD family pilus assembly protein [Alphaproteobacteria bacterium]
MSTRGPRFALVTASAILLAACQQERFVTNSFTPAPSATEQYPISVERSEVKLNLDIMPGMHELTPMQKSEVSAFVATYRRTAGGEIVVRAPSGTANESAARNALIDIHAVLENHGIPRNAIRYVPYANGSAGSPPVILSYLGFKAVASDCRNWSRNLSVTAHNRISPNLGCASQHNLAAQIADPRDLERVRAMDPSSSERRDVVNGKYIQGEPTAAKESTDNNGTVSDIGND